MLNSGTRDNFSPKTVEQIAKQSGYICAYPDCKRMTIAGSIDRRSGITLTGQAAHITAASANGPRYDSNMSPDERSSESNGIWTCQIHGKFIDDNPSVCSVEELRRWKAQHEAWVFARVESGRELFNRGIHKLRFGQVGTFQGEYTINLGRHNVLVGPNASGKTTICEIISALSGGSQWHRFNKRFNFSNMADSRSYIEISHQSDQAKSSFRLSPQSSPFKKNSSAGFQRIEVEVNGCPCPDWPRNLFNIFHFEDQLRKTHKDDPKDIFVKAIRSLADTLRTDEELIWGSLRDEFFSSSLFGYRVRRTGKRKAEIRVPDGRNYYLDHGSLSYGEICMAYMDIVFKFANCISGNSCWLFLFDSGFFMALDAERQRVVFETLFRSEEIRYQSVFCVNSEKDAAFLKSIKMDKWVMAEHFGALTIHSYL